eukprot:gene1439-3918_t
MIGLPAAPGDGAGCLSPPAASAAASSCLALKWKRLSALDAALLAALLEHNPRITQLDLSWNTELGDAAPALGAAIEASRTLADVNLSETSVCARPEGVAALRRAITAAPALVRLNLQHSGACAEAAASLFEAAAARLRGTRPGPVRSAEAHCYTREDWSWVPEAVEQKDRRLARGVGDRQSPHSRGPLLANIAAATLPNPWVQALGAARLGACANVLTRARAN